MNQTTGNKSNDVRNRRVTFLLLFLNVLENFKQKRWISPVFFWYRDSILSEYLVLVMWDSETRQVKRLRAADLCWCRVLRSSSQASSVLNCGCSRCSTGSVASCSPSKLACTTRLRRGLFGKWRPEESESKRVVFRGLNPEILSCVGFKITSWDLLLLL